MYERVEAILGSMQRDFKAFGEGLRVLTEKVNRIDARLERIEEKLDNLIVRISAVEMRFDRLERGQEALLDKFRGIEADNGTSARRT